MKALILAGGRGLRLNELSEDLNKCMIKISGRPVIEYGLDSAVNAGINEIVIVVGYKAEAIINAYGNVYKGKKLSYVIQWEQHGLVHAIECARKAIDGHDFMLLLGDEIMVNPRHVNMLKEFKNGDVFAICGILSVKDRELIKRTYSITQDKNLIVYRLIEKPNNPLNDLMGTGDCVFSNKIFDYIDHTPIHHERREKELPDLIQCAIDDGKCVKSFNICDCYANINSHNDINFVENILKSTSV